MRNFDVTITFIIAAVNIGAVIIGYRKKKRLDLINWFNIGIATFAAFVIIYHFIIKNS